MRLEGRERLIVHLADDPSSPWWIARRPDLTAKTNWTAFSDEFRYNELKYCPVFASLSLPEEGIESGEVKKTARILII
jgi:hypothetical protein